MRPFLTTAGGQWLEFCDETDNQAKAMGNLSGTAVGHVFVEHRAKGSDARFFVLRCPDAPDRFVVSVGVNAGPALQGIGPPLPLVTGYRNVDPFPQYEAEVHELGRALGITLGAQHYPYRRTMHADNAGNSGPGM